MVSQVQTTRLDFFNLKRRVDSQWFVWWNFYTQNWQNRRVNSLYNTLTNVYGLNQFCSYFKTTYNLFEGQKTWNIEISGKSTCRPRSYIGENFRIYIHNREARKPWGDKFHRFPLVLKNFRFFDYTPLQRL